MKVFKSISLFFLYPLVMFVVGFAGGAEAVHYEKMKETRQAPTLEKQAETGNAIQSVSTKSETLSVDTEYVVLETNILDESEVENTGRLPNQYIGMNREQFVTAIQNYSDFPPLSEQERGFLNAEPVSFSRERTVVRMNYHYLPSEDGFYLAVYDNEVVVYLSDCSTIYMNTGILLESLPKEEQLQIMDMLYIEDEGKLYSFLETFSS